MIWWSGEASSEAVHHRSDDAPKQSGRRGPYRQASPRRPGTAPAIGLRRGDVFFIVSQTSSRKEKHHVVLFLAAKLETLRARGAAAHTNVPSPTGQLPPAAGSAGRPLLAQRLPADQPGRLRARHCALHRPQPERLGHGFHAERVFRCGQHVHHRAGHVLQQLRPRAPADDHHPGVGIAGPRSGVGDRAGRPPHRRRLQSDE